MGPLGVPEMIFLFVLALLILGPRKLPELGRSIGKGLAEFRRASSELRHTFEKEMTTLEQEKDSLNREVAQLTTVTTPTDSTYSGYTGDYTYDDYSYSSSDTSSTDSVSAPQAAESQPATTPDTGASSPQESEVKSS